MIFIVESKFLYIILGVLFMVYYLYIIFIVVFCIFFLDINVFNKYEYR